MLFQLLLLRLLLRLLEAPVSATATKPIQGTNELISRHHLSVKIAAAGTAGASQMEMGMADGGWELLPGGYITCMIDCAVVQRND